MTHDTKVDQQPPEKSQASLLAEAYPKIRVLPAELARMFDVSKQTVSQWIKQGKVTLGPDGRLDPQIAARQVMENSDPARLRARVLRPLAVDVDALNQQIADRDAHIAYLKEFIDELDAAHEKLLDLVEERWLEISQLDVTVIGDRLEELHDEALLLVSGYADEGLLEDDGNVDTENATI